MLDYYLKEENRLIYTGVENFFRTIIMWKQAILGGSEHQGRLYICEYIAQTIWGKNKRKLLTVVASGEWQGLRMEWECKVYTL